MSDDRVNHPNHYTFGDIEVIDYIRDKLTPEEFQGYCEGNVLKYVSRHKHKNGVEDLKKAQVYLGWLIESEEKVNQQTGTQELLPHNIPITVPDIHFEHFLDWGSTSPLAIDGIPTACRTCSNHPSNGGSGICHCIMGITPLNC